MPFGIMHYQRTSNYLDVRYSLYDSGQNSATKDMKIRCKYRQTRKLLPVPGFEPTPSAPVLPGGGAAASPFDPVDTAQLRLERRSRSRRLRVMANHVTDRDRVPPLDLWPVAVLGGQPGDGEVTGQRSAHTGSEVSSHRVRGRFDGTEVKTTGSQVKTTGNSAVA